MTVKTTTGYIADANFKQISIDHYEYASPAPERLGKIYDIYYINKRWNCNCPDARIKHKNNDRCKHECALNQKLRKAYENRCMAEIEAEQVLEQIQKCKEQSEIEQLRAEIASLRAELEESRAIQIPDFAEIKAELAILREENEQIKKILATKATARKKHMSETEAAEIKEQINVALDDVITQAQNAIQAAQMVREEVADLEAIPHALKQELDRWTERGQLELQPDYQAPELPAEIKSAVREAQEADRRRREAPLNGNQGFSLLKK